MAAAAADAAASGPKSGSGGDWRHEMTPDGRHRYMLEHAVRADVELQVLDSGGEWVSISAHRYMLIHSSSVFEDMCANSNDQTITTLKIDDSPPKIVLLVLRFIYYGELDLTSSNVIAFLQSAARYKVCDLAYRCKDHINQHKYAWSWAEALMVYDAALVSGLDQIASELLDRIASNMHIFHNLPEWDKLSSSALALLLRHDELVGCTEVELYHSCVRWARAQCENQGQEPTDGACRDALGECLYLIRFPSMEPGVFTELFEESAILTPQEKTSVCKFFTATRMSKVDDVPFPTERRLDGFTRFPKQGPDTLKWRCCNVPECVDFYVNVPIVLRSVRVYSAREGEKECFVRVEVLQKGGTVLADKTINISHYKDFSIHNIQFPTYIPVEPRRLYTLRMTANDRFLSYYGINGHQTVTLGNVVITFKNCEGSNGTDISQGPIAGFSFFQKKAKTVY